MSAWFLDSELSTCLFVQQIKFEAIQVHISELSQQHEMLIEAMDQMLMKANKKLSFLEGRLTMSQRMVKVMNSNSSLFVYFYLSRITKTNV